MEHTSFSRIENINEKEIQSYSAINSGMVISLRVFDKYRYDENLFLDFVDHYFMRKMKERHKGIKILNCEIQQSFSGNSTNKENAKVRFAIFKKDARYFYKNDKDYKKVINRRKLSLSIKFKDPSFLKM